MRRAHRLTAMAVPLILATSATAQGLPGVQAMRPLETGTAERVYIVQFAAPPAVSEPGLRRHALGFEPRRADVQAYASSLVARHDAALADVGASEAKIYSYRHALNGFAARLTPVQAAKLRARKDVRRIWEDRTKHLQTNDSPAFLGLPDPQDGLWNARGLRGEGVVIGIIDSGIAPGHPSFSDTRPARRPRVCRSTWAERSLLGLWLCHRFKSRPDEILFEPPADWRGICQVGERFSAGDCNNKLIGARYYYDGFLQQYDMDPGEFLSARDADGHGTHTASVAAGNSVRASLAGTFVDTIQGVAPRARVAVYKACWLEPGKLRGSCSTADLARAIDDAVADGVDVINYSIGSDDDLLDPDDLALLAASDAGVLAVAAAGNEGPGPGSVLSPAAAPWVLAVGASSRGGDRFREALRVTAPDSLKADYAVVEAGFTPPLLSGGPVTAKLVLVNDGVLGAFDDGDVPVIGSTWDACEAPRNTADLDDAIALVQRGGCDFQDKLRNVQNAGAAAAVVVNTFDEPIVMAGTRDSVSIPAVMIGRTNGQSLVDALADGEPVEVALDKSIILTVRDAGNVMDAVSARGPNAWAGDILKPDVTAPGVNILGAHTPDAANNIRGERFQYLTGTSMAVPHVAGLVALLKEGHPEWTPAALKSALITTGRQDILKEDGTTRADAFDMGGGHVVPNAAVDPGLVYDAGTPDYDAFLCGRDQGRVDEAGCEQLADDHATTAADLNQPSIAVAGFAHERIIHRRVTNVGEAAQYTASVEAPPGVNIDVTPTLLSLDSGETGAFQVRLTGAGAALDLWQLGALTWTGGSHRVRSPIAARPVALETAALASGAGAAGTLEVPLRFGYSGPYHAVLSGLATAGEGQPEEFRALLQGQSVADDPDDTYELVQPATASPGPGVRRFRLVVPQGAGLLRVALAADGLPEGTDLDLYLYLCPDFGTCTEMADPATSTAADEAITIVDPVPGDYVVDVHGYQVPGAGVPVNVGVWTPVAGVGMGTLAGPGMAQTGAVEALSLTWADLPGPALGLITHENGSGSIGLTLVEIDTP